MIESVVGNPMCNIPVGFAGQFGVLGEPNGLYYMNARYYDPSMGRFLSEDPVGLGGGDLTLYSYAGNNPVVFADPSGLCRTSSTSEAIVGLASYGLNAAGENMMGLSATLFAGSMAGYGIAAVPTPASPEIATYSTFALSASGYAGIAGGLLIGTSQILQQQYVQAIATGLLTVSGKPVGKIFEALGASKGLSEASEWITEQYFETQRVRK